MAKETTMPYNRDAEMALLGCFLIDSEVATDLIETLSEEDFYQESHKYILRAMKRVFDTHKPIDIVTVSDDLGSDGSLEKAGGLSYITELTQITPSAANYKTYYEIVKRDSTNRKLIRASRKITENSLSAADGQSAIAYAEKLVYDISQQSERSSLLGMSEGEDVVGAVLEKFEKLQADPNAFQGVPTGFKRLDYMTHGLQAGALIVLAARPGMGKTSLAMNLVEHASLRAGKVCAVFSLEMPRSEIVQRLICSYAQISMKDALNGKLNATQWKKLMRASDQLKKARIYIDDSSRVTPGEILSKSRRLKSQVGLDMIMIDYIQLMSSGDNRTAGAENRQQEIASITRELKIMAKELGVPVVALSQLRRIQSKEPQLSDLRESGAIEQDADIVMFINRPDSTATQEELASGAVVKGAAELHIAKHRGGEQGRVSLKFIGECTKFVDVDEQNKEEEPPEYIPPTPDDDDEEYEYQDDDGYIPPMPPERKGELKPADEELPFD